MGQSTLLTNVILVVLALLIVFVFVGVIYAVVYAIFMFVFSGGNEEKIKKAWNSIRYALLGFILTLIILFAIPGFLRIIKVPGYRDYTSSNIFKTAKMLINQAIEVFSDKKNYPVDVEGDYNL